MDAGVPTVKVEVALGLNPVHTGVLRVEVDVWFVNLRRDWTAYLSGGIGKLAREICMTEDKSNKVIRP